MTECKRQKDHTKTGAARFLRLLVCISAAFLLLHAQLGLAQEPGEDMQALANADPAASALDQTTATDDQTAATDGQTAATDDQTGADDETGAADDETDAGDEEDPFAEDEPQEAEDGTYSVSVLAPPMEKRFQISENDPQVLKLAKEQTPSRGKLVTRKGKTFFKLRSGKRLKSSWVWYRGNAYRMNANGYALKGIHSYKGFLYYFDGNGRLAVKKFFTYKNKKYYACKTGALVTGAWCKAKHTYRYFKKSGAMAVNTRIDGIKVNCDGEIDFDAGRASVKTGTFRAESKKQKLIIVGASRVVQMARAVRTDGDVIYIARSGEGFKWFTNRALPKLTGYLKKYPRSKVVIQLGNNDMKKKKPDARIADYIEAYKKLIRKWPKARFYLMDILPSGRPKAWRENAVKQFNSTLAMVFPANYIGGWGYMTNNGFRCSYNLEHYSNNTSREIYNYILRKIR